MCEIHPCSRVSASHALYCRAFCWWPSHKLFIYPLYLSIFFDVHLGSFRFGALRTMAATSNLGQVLWCPQTHISVLRGGILGQREEYVALLEMLPPSFIKWSYDSPPSSSVLAPVAPCPARSLSPFCRGGRPKGEVPCPWHSQGVLRPGLTHHLIMSKCVRSMLGAGGGCVWSLATLMHMSICSSWNFLLGGIELELRSVWCKCFYFTTLSPFFTPLESSRVVGTY